MARTRLTVAVLLAAAAFVVVIAARRPTALAAATHIAPDSLTFAADVAPILYKNCVTCHRPGGIGKAVREGDGLSINGH